MLNQFANDLRASLVVFLVSLPICLGAAVAAGLPVTVGLIAGAIGGMVVGVISGSRLAVTGPVPGLAVVYVGVISSLGSMDGLMVILCLVGVIQLALGLAKYGSIGDYFPSAVVKGILSGVGLLIIIQQLPHVVGLNYWRAQEKTHLAIIALGIFSLLFLFVWDRLKTRYALCKQLPGGLLVVIVGIAVNYLLAKFIPALHIGKDYLLEGMFTTGTATLWENFFQLDWSALQNIDTIKAALVIAATASLVSILNLDAIDDLDKERPPTSKNRELVAQGVGNLACGLLGGLPILTSSMRAVANKASGAETRLATILHGLWLLLCALLLMQTIALIPVASLAALLVYIGIRMNSPQLYRKLFRLGRSQFLPFVVTTVTCAFVDFISGIGFGMATSIFFIMKSNIDSPVTVTTENGRYIISIMKDISFLNRPLLRGILDSIPDNSEVVFNNARPTPLAIDRDVISLLEDFLSRCRNKHIKVSFRNTASLELNLDNT